MGGDEAGDGTFRVFSFKPRRWVRQSRVCMAASSLAAAICQLLRPQRVQATASKERSMCVKCAFTSAAADAGEGLVAQLIAAASLQSCCMHRRRAQHATSAREHVSDSHLGHHIAMSLTMPYRLFIGFMGLISLTSYDIPAM